VYAQVCAPPAAMTPNGTINASIDATSCVLPDGTSFAAYSLNLPTRGNLQVTLKGAAGFAPTLILRDGGGHLVVSGSPIAHYSEAGRYTVVVNTAKAKQLGTFSLTSVFTPEAYTLCRSFPSIGTGQTISGGLSSASCKLPDQTSYDAYWITVYGAGTLTVTMTAAAFDSYVILRGNDGSLLTSADAGGTGNPASITLPVSGSDTYTIVAAAGSATAAAGTYQLSTVFTPNSDETCVSQGALDQTLSFGGMSGGTIDLTSCNFNLPNREDYALFNFYTLHVDQAGLAQITIPDSSFEPMLLLLDANGNQIAQDSQSGGENTPLLNQQLAPGDYQVVIFNEDSFEGDYDLEYSFTPGPSQPCPTTILTGGVGFTGELDGQTSCRSLGFAADQYEIVLPVAGRVNVDLSSQDFTSVLFLQDSKNNMMYFGEDSDYSGTSHIAIELPAGTYYALAASADLPGGYTINYAVTPLTIPACSSQTIPMASGSNNTVNGSLSWKTSCPATNGSLSNHYTVTVPASSTVAAIMVSADVNSVLFLVDSKGNPLRTDSGSYGAGNAIIIDYLAAGTYTLETLGAGFQNTGSYQLSALFTAATSSPKTCAAKSAAVGKQFTGSLSYTSCQYPDDTFADIYQVSVTDATHPIDIAAVSAAFDDYLVLLDSKGNVVGTDDNSGGGTDAHLLQNVSPGTYFVVVKPASDPSGSGSYTLTVK
jgi:hypothetical protein